MSQPRRTFSPEFPTKLTLAALKGDETVAELAELFELHLYRLTNFRQSAAGKIAGFFFKEEIPKLTGQSEAYSAALRAKIGQLTLGDDFLERALSKAGLLRVKR